MNAYWRFKGEEDENRKHFSIDKIVSNEMKRLYTLCGYLLHTLRGDDNVASIEVFFQIQFVSLDEDDRRDNNINKML